MVAHAFGWAFPGDSGVDVLLPVVLLAYWVPLALGVLVLLRRMVAGWVRALRHREWGRASLKFMLLCGLVTAGVLLMNARIREPVVLLVALLAAGAVCAFAALACTLGYVAKGILSAGRKRSPMKGSIP